jgi:ABC-type lipoprotein release transport system permease subunit
MPIVLMRSFTFPHMLANPAANAFSVPVFVGAVEFRNMSSTVFATVGAAVALLLTVASGIFPAWQAAKLPVVQALRRVE